jgi:hypothetical protein
MWKRIESSPGATGGHSARVWLSGRRSRMSSCSWLSRLPAVGREQVDALADVHEVLQVAGAGGVAVVLVEQADEVAPCLPQAASSGWAKRCRFSSAISAAPRPALLARMGGAQQLLVGDDVGPVVLAGVVDAHQHLGPARQGGQHLQRLARHRRDAEDDHPARQAGGPLAALGPRVDPAQEGLMHRRPALAGQRAAARRRHVGQQRPPQAGLPALLVGQGGVAIRLDQHVVARRPGGQPVGAIHLVLVEQVGQPLGELEALAQVGVRARKRRSGA